MTIYAQIDAALSHEERAAFLDRLVGLNPHLAGGSVADFLEMMTDNDDAAAVVTQAKAANPSYDAEALAACVRVLVHLTSSPLDTGRLHTLYAAATA